PAGVRRTACFRSCGKNALPTALFQMVRQHVAGGNDSRLAAVFSNHRNISLTGAYTFIRRDSDVEPAPLPARDEGSACPAGGERSVALAVVEPCDHLGFGLHALQFGSHEVLCERAVPGENAVPVCGHGLSLHDLPKGYQHRSLTEACLRCC